jgi:hypothetical protein
MQGERRQEPMHHPEGKLSCQEYFLRVCQCGCRQIGAWPCRPCGGNFLGTADHHPRHQSRLFDRTEGERSLADWGRGAQGNVERDPGWAVSR